MNFAITGATGFVGMALVKEVLKRGHAVRVLTRNLNSEFPKSVSVFYGDITSDTGGVRAFLEGCDVLVNCAAEKADLSKMHSVNFGGVRNLLTLLLKEAESTKKAIHWVQLSSVSVYGPRRFAGEYRVVTESSKTSPNTVYGATKEAADNLVMNFSKNSLLTYSILRPSQIFGSKKRNPALDGLINAVKHRMFFFVGKSDVVMNFVHLNDVVTCLLLCSISSEAKGKIYNLSSDCLLKDVVEKIREVFLIKSKIFSCPQIFAKSVAYTLGRIPGFPLTVERVVTLLNRTYFPSDKIKKDLNFIFSSPMPHAIQDYLHR